jgi:hypothetical protein
MISNQFILLPPNSSFGKGDKQLHDIYFVDVLVHVFLNTSADILA